MRDFRCWLGHSWGGWIKGYADVGKNRTRWVRMCDRCYEVSVAFSDTEVAPHD